MENKYDVGTVICTKSIVGKHFIHIKNIIDGNYVIDEIVVAENEIIYINNIKQEYLEIESLIVDGIYKSDKFYEALNTYIDYQNLIDNNQNIIIDKVSSIICDSEKYTTNEKNLNVGDIVLRNDIGTEILQITNINNTLEEYSYVGYVTIEDIVLERICDTQTNEDNRKIVVLQDKKIFEQIEMIAFSLNSDRKKITKFYQKEIKNIFK